MKVYFKENGETIDYDFKTTPHAGQYFYYENKIHKILAILHYDHSYAIAGKGVYSEIDSWIKGVS